MASTSPSMMIDDLPRSAYWICADARCRARITGCAGVRPHLGQLAFQAFACSSEPAKWILDSYRPVGAGDYQALLAGTPIETRLTQAESTFDDVGNVLGKTLSAAHI